MNLPVQSNRLWKIIINNKELLAWLLALVYLGCSNPASAVHHTIFLPDIIWGIKSPGYNLGHSIAWLFRLEFTKSLDAHWLGIVALLVIIARIITLLKKCQKETL